MYTAWELCENKGYIVKIMDYMLFIVILMSFVVNTDSCRFGTNCLFPCNCNQDGCDQESGDCTGYGGCISTLPAGYGWGGPGCRVGNVAYQKASSQSPDTNTNKYKATAATNGDNACNIDEFSHTTTGNPAWLRVDLGGRYMITDVIVYDRGDQDYEERLRGSEIQILDGDQQTKNVLISGLNYVKSNKTVSVTLNMPGDAVRIYKEGSDPIIHICELVVMGHPYVARTTECEIWDNDVIGCSTCKAGKMLPDCIQDCPLGYYAVNCQNRCSSNCKSGSSRICDPVSGRCRNGCLQWYLGDKCDTFLRELPIHNNDVSASSTSSSITVTWKPAEPLISGTKSYYHYIIRYKIIGGTQTETPVIELIDEFASKQSYTISNLQRNTEYEYIVRSVRTANTSDPYDSNAKTIKTKCTAPTAPSDVTLTVVGDKFKVWWKEDVPSLDSGCESMTMKIQFKFAENSEWHLSSEMTSNEKEYLISPGDNTQCWARIIVTNNEQITMTTDTVTASFTRTIASTTQKSSPSDPGKSDTTSAKPDKNDPDKSVGSKEPSDVGMIAGVAVAGVIFVVLVVIVVLLFTRYRRSLPVFGKKKDKGSEQKLSIDVKFETGKSVTPMGDVPIMPGPAPPSSPKPKPISPRPQPAAKPVVHVSTSIPVSQLGSYIAKKRKERDGFKNEYATLPEDETAPCERGSLPENKTKNRFLNIRAYDHSRVILETENDDPFSDYINCNYIPGFDGNKEHYIAGQGPKPHNIVDLWRMIWQKKINRIAMMTNEIENSRRKCDRYWPENVEGSQQYGAITVTTMGIERFPFYTIRLLRVQKDGVSRSVRQFHFTAWIDKRIPEYAFPLLGFRKKVRMYDKQSTGPLFVHCSAGVGRTGTFIAIDYLLEQAKHKHTIDVRKWVNTMRGCRINMIQTLEQYIFVYDTLLEALACGDTSIPASELETTLKQLKVKQKGEKISPLEAQYKVIDDFRPVPKGEDFKALSEDNIHKNRDPNIYPSDLARPYLLTKSENGNDYINAVFVHGYNRSNHYLITQMPLPATAVDFWRMVCDIDIVTIVALNEINDEDCTPYWPDENDSTETYGPIEVAFKSSQDDEIASVSTFEITNNENGGRKKEVEHIRMLNWPDNTLPDPKNLIHIVNLLEQRAQLHNEGNVVIHCLKGVSNSGILVAALNMIEKLKIDQEIDVFTAVKAIRINRNMFIESFEQYEYLYQVAQTYKAMNDTYANFS